jgi:transposase
MFRMYRYRSAMVKTNSADDATSAGEVRAVTNQLVGAPSHWDGLAVTREVLNDEQWAAIEPLLPTPSKRTDGKGRPRRNDRDVLNGILWILRSGARWSDLPRRFPPHHTCHRRFREWMRAGVLRPVLEALADHLRDRGKIDVSEYFENQSTVPPFAQPHGVKGLSSWEWQTALVFLSPSTRRLLIRMKSPLAKQLPSSAC